LEYWFKGDGLLLEIRSDQSVIDTVKAEVDKAAGNNAIKLLQQRISIFNGHYRILPLV